MENFGNEEREMDLAFDDQGAKKRCLNLCKYQNEKIQVTSAEYPSLNVFDSRHDFCLVVSKLHSICQNDYKFAIFDEYYKRRLKNAYPGNLCNLVQSEIQGNVCKTNFTKANFEKNVNPLVLAFALTYAKDNLAKIFIFFKDPYYTEYLMDQSYSFAKFLGNIGGLVGLSIGFSVISCVECFYFSLFFNTKR